MRRMARLFEMRSISQTEGGRDAGRQVVAETLLRSRNARTVEEEEEVFEELFPQTLTPNSRRASLREVFWSVDALRRPIMRALWSW